MRCYLRHRRRGQVKISRTPEEQVSVGLQLYVYELLRTLERWSKTIRRVKGDDDTVLYELTDEGHHLLQRMAARRHR